MKLLKYGIFGGIVLLALALSGCLFIKALPTGVIEGYVTDHLSGEPVVAATVRAWPKDGEPSKYYVITDYYSPVAKTNSEGYYKLVVPEGMYVVEARKEGHATSRVIGVKVGSTARVDIVQKPVLNPDWSLEPPTVTVTVTDPPGLVLEGATITAPIKVKIEARGDNDISLIYAAFGKTPGAAYLTAPRPIYSGTYSTGEFTIDPAVYGVAGWTTFEVVVYDQNENRVRLIYRVKVDRPALGAAPAPPIAPIGWMIPGHIPMRTALAVTLGRKLEYYGEAVDPLAAPAGGNLYVELRWQVSPDDLTITGYRIYRKLAGEPDFRLIYTVDRGTTMYRDSTPDLKVGVKATYRIVAYRWDPATGTALESSPLEAETTPLPAWDVRVVSPADGASGVDLLPTFTWDPINPPPGATQLYQIRIWDTPHGAYVITTVTLVGVTSWTYLGIPGTPFERLQPQRMYQWEVRGAIAYDVGASAVSVAVNNDYTGAFPRQVHPDKPAFTTRDW